MQRRSFIVRTTIALVGLAGCLDDSGGSATEAPNSGSETENRHDPATAAGTETPTEARGSPDPVEDIMIDTHISSPDRATVRITVSNDEQTIVEKELLLDPGERRFVATGIRETGRYELTVAVEGGPEGSFPFNVDDYALRQGSNLIVQLHEDDVSLMIEE